MSDTGTIPIRLSFGGGLEAYFSNKRTQTVQVPSKDESGAPSNAAFLIRYLHENIMQYHGEAKNNPFVTPEGDVRPGILVLIGDPDEIDGELADWELEGEGAYVLKPNTLVSFISSLHGG
ncbi:ubiquitin-like modifier 1 [Pseudovirgaria hyperparasitica]|uniref:Ubiquitin-related modifier 1 n=1 Tax=Pseudovirgaria hyperparasitica TaxID=470096 RepID=A0A6A6WBJ8_9PEZI|nr:ubiquitin-like modifier 1 [Pseudovirgaria hyperparasitica]KAF2758977.1 ubiquitin-like modifier 1 [Pseudovirgaria hyperparasitica]